MLEVMLVERADVAALDVRAWLRTAIGKGAAPVALELMRHVVSKADESLGEAQQRQPEASGKRLREDVPEPTPSFALAMSDDGALLVSLIQLPDGPFRELYAYL